MRKTFQQFLNENIADNTGDIARRWEELGKPWYEQPKPKQESLTQSPSNKSGFEDGWTLPLLTPRVPQGDSISEHDVLDFARGYVEGMREHNDDQHSNGKPVYHVSSEREKLGYPKTWGFEDLSHGSRDLIFEKCHELLNCDPEANKAWKAAKADPRLTNWDWKNFGLHFYQTATDPQPAFINSHPLGAVEDIIKRSWHKYFMTPNWVYSTDGTVTV